MSDILLVGTYSDTGVYKFAFENGLLSLLKSEDTYENCSFISKNSPFIFSTVEFSNSTVYNNGLLVVRNSDLEVLNVASISGHSPCYSYFDCSRNLLYIANYSDGSLNVFSVDDMKCNLIFSKSFTASSHIHCIELSEDKSTLFLTDLGDEKLYAYNIFYEDGLFALNFLSSFEFCIGSGPRHFAVDGSNLYLVTENSCELYHFAFSRVDGFSLIKCCSILPKDKSFSPNYTGCSIRLSDDKKFIYVSVRGLDVINVFSTDFEIVQSISCYGKNPRDLFLIDNFLLCANQLSDSITSFGIDKKTGNLSYNSLYKIGSPACIIKL